MRAELATIDGRECRALDWHYSAKQLEALRALRHPGIDVVLYGGAKGGGKTVLGCRWLMMYADEVIQRFGLEATQFPLCIGWMGRKKSVAFTTTALETWKREIPPELYEIKEQKREIVIRGAVKYGYGGFDSQEDLNKFNSAEFAVIWIEQAEEIELDEYARIAGTLRLQIEGVPLDYKTLLTANPRICWLKREFVDSRDPRKRFIRALPADNPWLPDSYVPRLREVYRHRPELIEANIKGSWTALSGSNVVIQDGWIDDARRRHASVPGTRRLIACDVAREGDDRTVCLYMLNTRIEEAMVYSKKTLTYTANELHTMGQRHKAAGRPPAFVIDDDGIGGGVTDNLRAMGNADVIGFKGAAAAQDEHYYNQRAEAWFRAADLFAEAQVDLCYTEEELAGLPGVDEMLLRELATELATVTYDDRPARTVGVNQMIVESKKEIKRSLGQSPDLADAYIMGLWGLRRIEPDETRENDIYAGRRRQRKRERGSAWAA